MKISKYHDALDYLYNFVDFSRTHQENIAPENFSLERMFMLMEALKNPQKEYPCIHVAGTKGKGSVSVFCASALQASDYKVGLYTSPHLQSFTERIQINRDPIPENDFVEIVNYLKPIVESIPGLTSYEIQTAIAFIHFARNNVDVAVIEVGMGGRLDSTNIITPLVSVITSISMDHTFVLGDTLAEIAGEKGGIIKEGVPVVSAPQINEVSQVLRSIAQDKQSDLYQVGDDWHYQVVSDTLSGQEINVSGRDEIDLFIKMLGEHQAENAVTAYGALMQVKDQFPNIDQESIKEGFKNAFWEGRFEIVSTEPYVVFDGAHNRYSAGKLRKSLDHYFQNGNEVFIIGASSDKDIKGIIGELLNEASTFIPVASSHPRAISQDELIDLSSNYPEHIIKTGDIYSAIKKGLELAGPSGLLIITGSLYLVGEVRQIWFDQFLRC
jgi:dihydrofolate synthase/folylpolyglutamate synthase